MAQFTLTYFKCFETFPVPLQVLGNAKLTLLCKFKLKSCKIKNLQSFQLCVSFSLCVMQPCGLFSLLMSL